MPKLLEVYNNKEKSKRRGIAMVLFCSILRWQIFILYIGAEYVHTYGTRERNPHFNYT
jgi:hypothetical protein